MTALIIGLACLFGPLSLLLLLGAVTYLLRRLKRDTYPPEVAEVPDPVDEHFEDLEALFRLPAYIKEQSNG